MSQVNSTYARKARDLYETPAWVTDALVPHLPRAPKWIWEPACGGCAMLDELSISYKVTGTDIATGDDFLHFNPALHSSFNPDAIITNPPYGFAQQFIERALTVMEPCQGMVAMLLRTDYDHAKSRVHLFRDCPAFSKKVVLNKRIVWFVEDDGKPKASPSENHAWFLWDWQHEGPPTIGYAPC